MTLCGCPHCLRVGIRSRCGCSHCERNRKTWRVLVAALDAQEATT